jgi:phospholipid/cholesterol/gamma-HCH transport system substrate-binding protein
MQKQAPTLWRLMVMVIFTLSCFGLLLFLWLSFGGPVPLKPKGYRFQVAFPQAVQLAEQSDVRIAGVTVGKVVKLGAIPSHPNRETATIEMLSKFAPVHTDAQAILRQKTLLGETYIEMTPGTGGAPVLKDGAFLANSRVQPNVYFDQVLQAFDSSTRQAFRNWQQDLAQGSINQGQNINDAIGNLPQFTTSATDVLQVLNSQSHALSQLVRNTGGVFGAISRNTQALHNLVVNSGTVFQTTSDERRALAEIFRDFPPFLRQSRSTLAKLQTFSTNTDPLIRQLQPTARELKPTLTNIRGLSPSLLHVFQNLDPLITASQTGLPATRDVLHGAIPLLAALDPFLEQLNPILQYLEVYQAQTGMFLGNSGAAVAGTTPSGPGEVGHYLRQFNPGGPESLAIYQQRPKTNRGNTYQGPNSLQGAILTKNLIFPTFDCNNTGGEHPPVTGASPEPGCTVDPPIPFQGQPQKFPHIQPDNYRP